MQSLIDPIVEFERITPADEQWFFGYYDNPAYSLDDARHLATHVQFRDRLQGPDDVADLCVVDLCGGGIERVAQTKAWNFQQGAMFQWLGSDPDSVFYNAADGDGTYRGVVHALSTGETRRVPRAVANVSRCGRWGLAVNFDRIFDFRPGYGYCQKRDPFFDENHPEEDGVFLVDIERGTDRQILSLQTVWEAMKESMTPQDQKIVINHITFNPSADRFVLLARNFPTDSPRWITTVFVSDLDGNLSPPLYDATIASHYYWTDDDHLLFYSQGPNGLQLYSIKASTQQNTLVDPEFFKSDGHCSTSADGEWMLYDSYPRNGYRYFYLYNMTQKRGVTLGGLRDEPVSVGDVRSDLHPRWNRAGTGASVDATFEGFRGI
jgi:hypothetical protein